MILARERVVRWMLPVACVALAIGCAAVFVKTGWETMLFLPLAIGYVWLTMVDWKKAYWLLLFTIPVSVDIELGSFSSSFPDEPMTWLLLFVLIALVAFKPTLILRKALLNPVVVIVAAQLIWTAVATGYSTNGMLSLKYLFVRVWLLAVFFLFPLLIFRDRRDFATGFRVVAAPMLATVAIIVARHAALGFEFSRITDAIGKLYYNHVEYSTMLSMLFPAACLVWPLTNKLSPLARGIYGFALVLLAVGIFLSYARAALLAVVFAFAVAACIHYRLGRAVMPLFYTTLIAFSTWLVHENKYLDFKPDYAQTYMHTDLASHMEATFSGTDMSGMERVYRWIAAVRMSRERPLTGFGPNTFVASYKPYALSAFRTYVSHNPERSTTHNYFLYLLAEQGWPGMLLYALLIPAVIAAAQKAYFRFTDPFYKRCTLAAAVMFAAAFVNNFFSELTDTHKVGALFHLSMALVIIFGYKSRVMRTACENREQTSQLANNS